MQSALFEMLPQLVVDVTIILQMHSVCADHPHFFNQLFVGLDPYAMVGSFVTDATQPSL